MSAPPPEAGAPDDLIRQIDGALPQTQCQRCGYPDCHAYARALVLDGVPVNRCPPGGESGVQRLAQLLRQPGAAAPGAAPLALDPDFGQAQERYAVRIIESDCIGCTLCLQACPVDCIVGGPKRMHTVIEADCTGCELCLPACPVDCISAFSVTPGRTGWDAWSPQQAQDARSRYTQRQAREAREARKVRDEEAAGVTPATGALPPDTAAPPAAASALSIDHPATRHAILAAALATARRRRGAAP